LLVDDHEGTVAEIRVDGYPATASLTPIWFMPLHVPPPLAAPPVQDDLDLFVLGEIPPQMVPKVRLVSCHDEQASNLVGGGLYSQRPCVDWHLLYASAGAEFRGEGNLLPPYVERRWQPRCSPADADYFLSLIAA